KTVGFVLNRTVLCPDSSVTPYERWYGHSPNISMLRVWGCDAQVLVPHAQNVKLPKFTDKAKLCMLVGYTDDGAAYRFYDPSTSDIITSRHAIFNETRFTVAAADREHELLSSDDSSHDPTDDRWDDFMEAFIFENE